MEVTLSGHHVELTQAIKDYVHEKLEKLQRHTCDITTTAVILSVDKNIQKAEAKAHYKGVDVFAEETSSDLYAAIDGLIDKLDRQLIKHKEKVQQKRA